jgi:hypothetical protein
MISEVLNNIVTIINSHISPKGTDPFLGLADISQIGDGEEVGRSSKSELLLSVVHVEEHPVKNSQINFKREKDNIGYKYLTMQRVHGTVLFSATNDYENSLRLLEKIIRFFQAKNVFMPSNTPQFELMNKTGNLHLGKITFDRANLNLAQLQQLWNVLGGDYRPSVVFKMSMFTVKEHDVRTHEAFLRRHNMGQLDRRRNATI